MADDPKPEYAAFAQRLDEAIHEARLTYAEVGRRMGVKRATVSKWAAAKSAPAYKDIAQLERVVGVPQRALSDALAHHEQEAPPPGAAGYDARISQLDPEERAAIDAIIETYERRRGSQ